MTNEECLEMPNVALIRKNATRIVHGRVPAQVRNELARGVKLGLLGHLKRDGLKPEIYFHPDHKHGAIDMQSREAAYAINCIRKVIDHPGAE